MSSQAQTASAESALEAVEQGDSEAVQDAPQSAPTDPSLWWRVCQTLRSGCASFIDMLRSAWAWLMSKGVMFTCPCCCFFCGAAVALIFGLAVLIIVIAWICAANQPDYASVLVKDSPGGDKFTLDDMSALPSPGLYAQLRGEVSRPWTHEGSGYTYGYAGVHLAPELLYNGTKVPGVFDKVPDEVKGVFWMKGNGLPEVLATLQNAEWFEDEQILLMPNSPFSWTWWGGEKAHPDAAAGLGIAYHLFDPKSLAESQGEGNITVATSFSTCPKDKVCDAGSTDLTYADIQSHGAGDLKKATTLTRFFEWTLELADDAPRGALWYRGVSILCGRINFGSYWLTKIIDGDGKRIEPHYSQYVSYMEGADQIIWTGLGPGHHLE